MWTFLLLACGPLTHPDASDKTTTLEAEPVAKNVFLNNIGRKFCAKLEECNPALECDPDQSFGLFEDCAYNAEAAGACLEAEFTCEEVYDVAFVLVPPVCFEVFDCPGSAYYNDSGLPYAYAYTYSY